MSEVCVRVALRIRPLLPKEVLYNHQACVRVVPGSAQVMLGSDRLFSFDHVFGPTASQDEVHESCVEPLVESLVDGYNATVFCYGQTGSGKTYTIGGGNLDEEGGIIDRVAQDVFLLLEEKRKNGDGVEATVRVSYMELYREELRDLLELHTNHKELHIREDERGNTVVVGAKEMVVTSAEELLSVLETGNALRHTGTTGMNEHSSRSHAILTLQLIQCCHSNNSSLKSVRSSKLCLVDLAGSERAGKTGNSGTRIKESIHINTGLLALGNVIRALSEPGRNRRGNNCNSAHIPYRDAKITRLLRDSLGGTAHTLMVACVSPSHHSVAETLSVLQFASKARHIRNRPRTSHTDVKSSPTTWDPGEARLGELEYEVQTLRELLKEKEIEIERQRTSERAGEGDSFKQPSQMRMSDPDKKVNQEETSQYRILAQEAAALLADISGPTPSHCFRQRLQGWQERLTAVNQSHQADEKDWPEGGEDQPQLVTILKLSEELNTCKEALAIEEQLLEQKNAELRQVQKKVEKFLQESKTHLQAMEKEKERTRIQTEQLVDQQILINRLRSDLMTFMGAASGGSVETGASGNSGKRPHSVPLIRQSCGHGLPRRIHSSPPAYSLERVMAAFKMRSHLLLAEIEDKEEVYCPFIKQQAESKDREQENEEEEDTFVGRMGFRRSLNRTWTSQLKKSVLKEKISGLDQTFNGSPLVQQPQRVTANKEDHTRQSKMRNVRLRASVTQRRIRELSVNMRMKEELIKELDKTDKETQAADRKGGHNGEGREVSVLARLSIQSQQVRAEVYHSLQHMRLQRTQLQSSLRQHRETNNNKELQQNGEQRAGDLTVCKSNQQEELKEKLLDSGWLEEEEQSLQKRAELQELEEELWRREEVLLRREACLQQKNKLEIKMLRSSKALSQDLLRVSVRLESLEEQLESGSSVRQTGGVTMEELEKERDTLKKRRDTLDGQLKDNRVLTVEEEHSLLQLEEAIEALEAALEFKNHSIQDRQKKLQITDSSSHQSQSTEPAQLCDVIMKLKELSPPEASELLVRYFNKVVCLREAERHLRLHCEELELHAGEQEVVLRQMEVAMQRLALDADRRLTHQHQDHQNNMQLLLQKLKEGGSGEAQQAIEGRLQHLEKELFFYKSSSRQLKKKLKELLSDSLHPIEQPSNTEEQRQKHNVQLHASANEPQLNPEEVQTRTHIATTYTKINTEQTDKNTHNVSHMKRHEHQTPCPSSSSDLQASKITKMPEYNQAHTQSQLRSERGGAHSGESLEMTPVRMCRRELRQISPADLQVCSSATRRRQSVVDNSTESILEDSIEMSRNTDR
ncbi:LOW QUALITY PROTEIN: kinesin-like protein KIF27 [Cottoperca gobio]|uniref:LOW QUALITY PROTEIN: kinesin-like protein KIF27 n=1 Tax=Cottoperca gobio TaxID=56716 RepID=A0A6J2QGK9_COTGO|nr:LOW QUALITY PROTEIN: kinesin-like protein KIF27 [Cottoperca gobio]